VRFNGPAAHLSTGLPDTQHPEVIPIRTWTSDSGRLKLKLEPRKMNIKRTRFRQTWLNAARSASSSTLVSSTMQLDKIIRGRDHKFESALFPTGS
ncbi:MAG: hypothetical protein DMG14_24985, partial [Acidobacteria bacterium]